MRDSAKVDHANFVRRILDRGAELGLEICRVREGWYLRYCFGICCVFVVFFVGAFEAFE